MRKILLWLIGIVLLAIIGTVAYIMINSNNNNDDNDNNGTGLDDNTSAYDCSSDAYNCANFTTQKQAQAVYDFCVSEGKGDIHQLDADGNGKACEGLA
ncbi:MAG: excalibur calcium-binding domain-containing protein [Candidatus Pacearchaeota archaeon]|nr:excalibur calcium-binding domain-containing protein [Candidatus Pacearchaeota archaeon]